MSKLSLTPRQQFWVDHLRACAALGQSLSYYAAANGLKIGAMYEAKSRLRTRGLGYGRFQGRLSCAHNMHKALMRNLRRRCTA